MARALLGPIAGAILLLQSLLVPMLDAAEAGHRPVFESKHDAASCFGGHDHTICVQVGANHAVTSSQIRLAETRVSASPREAPTAPALRASKPVRVHGPRGPPIA